MCGQQWHSGKQSIIVWCKDENKLSHVDSKAVTEMLEVIKWHFGDLVINKGNDTYLLGREINMDRKNKNVIIDVREKLKNVSKISVKD